MDYTKILQESKKSDSIINNYIKEDAANFGDSAKNIERGIPKAKMRVSCENPTGYLASFNERENVVYYHPDIIYMTDKKLLKTIIAHEMCHWAAGKDDGHGPRFHDCADNLQASIDIYPIYDIADGYDLKDAFECPPKGMAITNILDKLPDLGDFLEVKAGLPVGALAYWDEENEIFFISPYIWGADSLKELDKEMKQDINIELNDFDDYISRYTTMTW